jgi:hypothetical protein
MAEDVTVKSNVENLELYSDNYPFRLTLRINNFENEAEYKKFIMNCEATIRRSREYKLWREYIADVLQINACMITQETMDDVTIEVHHHIPSLYAIVTSFVNKKIEAGEAFCTFDICREVIEFHFANKVGYVTLLKSMHEKFHNGKLDIPISLVRGDYDYFMKNYSKYLSEQDLDIIQSRLATNETNCSWARDNYQVANS